METNWQLLCALSDILSSEKDFRACQFPDFIPIRETERNESSAISYYRETHSGIVFGKETNYSVGCRLDLGETGHLTNMEIAATQYEGIKSINHLKIYIWVGRL